ncbi:family 43 glycosylhydrolase [Sphingobacterium bambusae]|uniref:Family 43 glycosylhydrolase n=1 Tax=Sphingobacterium bambusae TaxID=662858 RepID=A0ABW6BKX7_9SPHI|nr:family 43 glycosylhydrolase [Sphingobacterium bambusae]WPL50935.1 family 43 glycosylhydrolase [Sphingobacterium bambusae]
MKKAWIILLLLMHGIVYAQTIKNFSRSGDQLTKFDELGRAVDAHDGEVTYFEGKYYLYGTSYDCGFEWNNKTAPFCGFKSYSSTDMVNWTDEGFLFDAQNELWQNRCDGKTYGCFRPHVVFNTNTSRYVLWINVYDNVSGYRVFTSESPTGPFVEVAEPKIAVNASQPAAGLNNGDHDLFVDEDGRCYLAITDWRRDGAIVIEELTEDYLSGTGRVSDLVTSGRTEAPALFKRKGIYYLTYSDPNCGYCAGTGTSYKTAKSPLGPWSEGIQISDNSCGGQPSFVTALQVDNETVFLYGSDLWNNAAKNEALANFFWAPLTFDADGAIEPLHCITSFSMTRERHQPTEEPVESEESEFRAFCDIGNSIQRAQSFTANASGELHSFVITTLKSGYPTEDLLLSFYESEEGQPAGDKALQTLSIAAADIGWSAKPFTLSPHINVKAGKQYVVVLHSATQQGCYGFAFGDRQNAGPESASISQDAGKTFRKEGNRVLKTEWTIASRP